MGAGKYSAGRIFLQVVPSFKGVQREISREVKKYNDQMEAGQVEAADKAAKKAGKKATETVRRTTAMGEAERERFRKREEANEAAHQRRLSEIALKAAAKEADREQAHRLSEQAKDSDDTRARVKERAKRNAALELEDRRYNRQKARIAAQAALAERRAVLQRERDEIRDAKAHANRLEREAKAAANKAEREAARSAARIAKAEAKELERAHRAQMDLARKRGGAYRAAIEKALTGIEAATGSGSSVGDKYAAEFGKIQRAADSLRTDLDRGLLNPRQVRRQIREIEGDLQRIAARGAGGSETERANAKAALREIRELRDAQQGLARTSGRVGSFFGLMTREADDGANAFRIFNYRILGAVTLLQFRSLFYISLLFNHWHKVTNLS